MSLQKKKKREQTVFSKTTIEPDSLLDVMPGEDSGDEALTDLSSELSSETPPPCPWGGSDISVLIADDSSFYLDMISDMVQREICPREIYRASDGRQAMEIYLEKSPDVILLDWEMPKMSGLDTARKIRLLESEKERVGKYPYIIIITGRNSPDSFELAFRNGADDFIKKPVSREELTARILVGRRVASFSRKLVEQTKEMEKVARIDPLTELYNRKHGEERLTETLSSCARKGRPLAVCYCDLDKFKFVNDTWGHEAGDAVLREVSGFLKAGVRISDTAVRWGGDEFLLIFPETGGAETLVILNRIRAALSDFSVRIPNGKGDFDNIKVGISIGCAWGYPSPGHRWEEIVSCADRLLYEAKAERENNPGSLLSFASDGIPGWEPLLPEVDSGKEKYPICV